MKKCRGGMAAHLETANPMTLFPVMLNIILIKTFV